MKCIGHSFHLDPAAVEFREATGGEDVLRDSDA